MKLGAPARILAAAGVLALALLGLVTRENIARRQGQEVRLALAGYDPRSLLQGHYVQFQLQETLTGSQCPPGLRRGMGPRAGEPGWVALRRAGDHHQPAGAASTRAAALRLGEVAVRGRLDCFETQVAPRAGESEARRETVTVRMDLGVDRIHLEQAEAEAIEAELRGVLPDAGPPGHAVLSVGRDGKARVKGLMVGARRVDLDWF